MPPGRLRSLQDPETLRLFVEKLQEGIYVADGHGEILDANAACLEIFGVRDLEELRRLGSQDFFADPAQRRRDEALLAGDGVAREVELVIRRPDGEERTLLDTCHRLADPETGEPLYYGTLLDITERKRLEIRCHEQSLLDPLTGCFNRRYLQEVQKRLGDSHTWGTIVVDVDDFKEYNDAFGHQAGDEVLIKVSRFLQQNARAEDAVVRMGGDEFLLLLLGAPARFVAEVGQRLRESASAQGIPSFSVGWAARHGTESLERTIDHADRELLQIRLFERRSRQKTLRGPRQRLVEILAE